MSDGAETSELGRPLEDGSASVGPAEGDFPSRVLIAYHEAGHVAVGHAQGLTLDVAYVGDDGGQVIFDEQWDPEMVVRDADLLDRYGLMLLAGGQAERRVVGGAFGAEHDAETLERMLHEARRRGTTPNAGLWRRAEQQVAENWPSIEALAGELRHGSGVVDDAGAVLGLYPYLGRGVAETRGQRAREILGRLEHTA